MKTKNTNLKLNKAKKEKNDEYFTLYEDVERIFQHLHKDVIDKYRIILPFNDLESKFRDYCIKHQLNYEVVYDDYKNHFYRKNDLVISNPPFSKLKEIVDFFTSKKINFILIVPRTAFAYKIIFDSWKHGLVRFIHLSINKFLTKTGDFANVQCYLLTNLYDYDYPSIFWIPKKSNCKFDLLPRNKIVFNKIGKDYINLINSFKENELYFPITFLMTEKANYLKDRLENVSKLTRIDGSNYFTRIKIGVKNEK